MRKSGQNDVNIEALGLLWGRLEPQSHAQGGSGWPEVASDRAAGGIRTVILRSLGRLYGKSYNFLKCVKNNRKTVVFKGSRGSGRPSWSHLGPKVTPKRGRDSQNDLEKGGRRGQSSKS